MRVPYKTEIALTQMEPGLHLNYLGIRNPNYTGFLIKKKLNTNFDGSPLIQMVVIYRFATVKNADLKGNDP